MAKAMGKWEGLLKLTESVQTISYIGEESTIKAINNFDTENKSDDDIIALLLLAVRDNNYIDALLEGPLTSIKGRVKRHGLKAASRVFCGYEPIIVDLLESLVCNTTRSEMHKDSTVYCLGDSHTIGISQAIRLMGPKCRNYVCVGRKMWHLKDFMPQIQELLANHLSDAPGRQRLILCFGEIDCRIDEGIIRHHLRTGKPIKEIAVQTVNHYRSLIECLRESQHVTEDISVIPVISKDPSLHGTNLFTNTILERMRSELIQHINNMLFKMCSHYDCSFVKLDLDSSLFLQDSIHLGVKGWSKALSKMQEVISMTPPQIAN